MKCDHIKYNKNCITCRDIVSQCNYAVKHGMEDFEPDFETNPIEWGRMVHFYNKPDLEPDEDLDGDNGIN